MRHATHDDIAALIELGRPCLQAHPVLRNVPVTDEQLQGVLTNIIDRGIIIVAESVDGSLVGALAGIISSAWCAPELKIASALTWWMLPGHRHGITAARMVQDFEDWAWANNADRVVLTDYPTHQSRAGRLAERLGYSISETAYGKNYGT
jgi:hypothetical protein